jgi:hypothetical protein
MLYVKQAQYNGVIVEVGQFKDIKEIYNTFKDAFGSYRFAASASARFSHDLYEVYSAGGSYYYDNTGCLRLTEREYCYVIENSSGVRYSRDTVYGLFNKLDKPRKYVPYFYGGKKRHFRSTYRRIAFFQELKAASGILLEEGEVKPRPSRSPTHLPNSWDEYGRFDTCDRNWKRYRKKQYKESGRI